MLKRLYSIFSILFIFRTEQLSEKLLRRPWKHLCFVRTFINGNFQIFLNGKLGAGGTSLKPKTQIGGPGTRFYLGQAWDETAGAFLLQHAYVGVFNDVNMWSEVLSETRIRQLFLTCRLTDGTTVAWSDLLAAAPSALLSSPQWECPVRRSKYLVLKCHELFTSSENVISGAWVAGVAGGSRSRR